MQNLLLTCIIQVRKKTKKNKIKLRSKQSPVLDRLTCLLYLLKMLRDPEDDESNVDQSDRHHPAKQQYKRKNYSTTK